MPNKRDICKCCPYRYLLRFERSATLLNFSSYEAPQIEFFWNQSATQSHTHTLTFWSWYSIKKNSQHTKKLTPTQTLKHTYYTLDTRHAAAILQHCVTFLWQKYENEKERNYIYMCIPINVYDITNWYNFSFLFKLSVLLLKWSVCISSIKNYIYIHTYIYGIWNNAIIDHTYNSLVEKVDQHKNLWEIRFINIYLLLVSALLIKVFTLLGWLFIFELRIQITITITICWHMLMLVVFGFSGLGMLLWTVFGRGNKQK